MVLYALNGERPLVDSNDVYIAPNAAVIGRVKIAQGASIWFGATLRGDTELIDIGCCSNVQDGCVFHTDPGSPLTLGADVTVGHNVTLHGCRIAPRTIIGMGAIILNNAVVSSDCIVAAGALIPEGKTFPAGSLILGSPAKVVRLLTPEEKQTILKSSTIYQQKALRFKQYLEPC